MPITLLSGPANSGKAEVVLDDVKRHLARGREPLLIVPTWADTEHYLRELAQEGVAMGARVERFDGLMDEAVRRARVPERPIGRLARERLIESLAGDLIRRGPGPGMLVAVGELIAELRARRVTPARFQQALSAWAAADGEGGVPLQLGRLYGAYHDTLRRLGRMDAEQQAVAALDALRLQPALWGGAPVLFYGFDDLTPLQLDAIETFGVALDAEVIVSLTYEPGRTALAGRAGSYEALAQIAHEKRSCDPRSEHYAPGARVALSHLERSLFEPSPPPVPSAGALRLLEGGGRRAELELVAREVARLLREGVAPEEIAVISRDAARSGEELEDVFEQAGISIALEHRASFAGAALGRGLLGLLRCVPAPDGFLAGTLGDLLAWLRCPGFLVGSAGREDAPTLADRLELEARRGGILDAAEARALWEARNWPLKEIDRLAEAQRGGPEKLLDRVDRELYRLYALPRRERALVLPEHERDEARALAAGRRALSDLRELAAPAPELLPGSALELARVLERVELFGGGRPGPGSVAVLDPLRLRARRVRALLVTGMQEGAFPAMARQPGLLSDDDRRRLAETSGLALGPPQDLLAAERYLLYALVSRPHELLVLSWHLADDDGEPVSRSLFVDDVCDLFEPELLAGAARRRLGATDLAPAADDDPRLALTAPLRAEPLLEELRERVWSPSAIESYIECPVRWFVQKLLEPRALDPDPEPFARGGLAHAALSETLASLREELGSARITAGSLARARQLLREALERGEGEQALSVVPERRIAIRRRLQADLERYLDHAAGSEARLEPEHLELGFGFTGEDDRGEASELPALDLGDGLKVRGRIDRIDRGPAGEAVVIDYKSKDAPAAARWLSGGRLQIALYMRAVEQLLDGEVIAGVYQPLSGKDLRPRGAVDRENAVGLQGVGRDAVSREELEALVEDAVQMARDAAAQARGGELEPRPSTCSGGFGCAFPTICRCER